MYTIETDPRDPRCISWNSAFHPVEGWERRCVIVGLSRQRFPRRSYLMTVRYRAVGGSTSADKADSNGCASGVYWPFGL
jgi:hypothetical protein